MPDFDDQDFHGDDHTPCAWPGLTRCTIEATVGRYCDVHADKD